MGDRVHRSAQPWDWEVDDHGGLERAGKVPVTARLLPFVARAADGNVVSADAQAALDRAAGSSGAPLPAELRTRFESCLDTDLAGVRVHTGGESAQAARAVGARAYAVGQDIHFAAGQYDPGSVSGQHLLAHEVAHTVQQAGGASTQRQAKLEVSSPGDALELEADRAADAMVAGATTPISSAAGSSAMLHRALPTPAGDATGAPPSAQAGAPGQCAPGTPRYSEAQRTLWLEKCGEANTSIDRAGTLAEIYLSTLGEAYSGAWEMHEDALKEADARQKAAEALIAGFVLAGLGGAAGGGVGVFVGNQLGEVMKKLISGGAIIDCAKDLAKFAVRKGQGAMPGLEDRGAPQIMPMPLEPVGFVQQINRTVASMVILPAQTVLKQWQHAAIDRNDESLDLTLDPALGMDTYLTDPIAHWIPLNVAALKKVYACGFLNDWIQTELGPQYEDSMGGFEKVKSTIIAYGHSIGFTNIEGVIAVALAPYLPTPQPTRPEAPSHRF